MRPSPPTASRRHPALDACTDGSVHTSTCRASTRTTGPTRRDDDNTPSHVSPAGRPRRTTEYVLTHRYYARTWHSTWLPGQSTCTWSKLCPFRHPLQKNNPGGPQQIAAPDSRELLTRANNKHNHDDRRPLLYPSVPTPAGPALEACLVRVQGCSTV